MNRADRIWLILLLVVAGLAGGAWYFWPQFSPPAVETVTPPPAEELAEPTPPTRPVHPLEPLTTTRTGGELVPLPPLADLDAYLRLELGNIFGNTLENLLVDEALIERFVATVDNLPRSHVAERIRPVGRLSGTFTVDSSGDDDSFVLSPANFDRYAVLVDMLEYASVDEVVDAYRRYYPLFQKSYVGLGYPDGYFNDRVIEVIDHLLAAPAPDGELQLTRPHVLYEYSDADLEALSSGQKLLLRMGNDQAARLKKVLTEFRARVANQ
jgi:hypothetical protein